MKSLIGVVVLNKMQNTSVVLVERQLRHPLYGKLIKRSKKYNVQDEIGVQVGDRVKISSCRPYSKTKTWKVTEVVKKNGSAS